MQGVSEVRSVRSRLRVVAVLLALTFALFSATTVTTQDRAHAVLPLLAPAAAFLPFSVVSAGVGGGVTAVGTGAALAGGAITAAAAFASNYGVKALFSWLPGTDPNLGAPTVIGGSYPNGWAASYVRHPSNGDITANITLGTLDGVKPYAVYYTVWFAEGGYGPGGFSGGKTTVVGARSLGDTMTVPSEYLYTRYPDEGHVCAQKVQYGAWVRVMDGYGARSATAQDTCPGSVPSTVTGGGAPGTTPLAVLPKTCYTPAGGGGTVCASGPSVPVTRADEGGVLDFPAVPAGGTLVSRSAPISRVSDGVVVGDATSTGTGTSPWTPPAVPAAYPDCVDRTCVMTLTVTSPDGSTRTCSAAGACPEYAAVVAQYPATGTGASTVARTAPNGDAYQCRFGAYAVAVAECQVIPGAGVGVGTGTGTGSEPDDCGFTLNPLTAVKCGLRWAFVPGPGVLQSAHATASAGFSSTGLPAWGTAVAGVGGGLAGVGANAAGCAGPAFVIPLRGKDYSFQPLNACSQPMQGVAVVIKVLISLAVCVAGAKLCARPLLASFGMDRAV